MHSEKRDQLKTWLGVSRPPTSDVFLFRSRLFGAGGLLDVNYQLTLRFVLVNWPGRIVDFIILVRITSPSRRPLPRPGEPDSTWEVRKSIGSLHRFDEETKMVEVTSWKSSPRSQPGAWAVGLAERGRSVSLSWESASDPGSR
jgi:hypothetical protein